MKKICNTELIELKLDGITKRIYFPDIPNLRGKKINWIDTFSQDSTFTLTTSPNNIALSLDKRNVFINLVKNNNPVVTRLPYTDCSSSPDGNNNIRLMINQEIDFSKSFIEISKYNYSTSSLLFLVHYGNFTKDIPKTFFSQNVTIKIDSATKTRFLFPELNELKDKKIIGLKLNNKGLAMDYDPNYNQLAVTAILAKSYLYLKCKNKVLSGFPLPYFRHDYRQQPLFWDNHVIDWKQSYIEVANITSLVQDSTFSLTFLYI